MWYSINYKRLAILVLPINIRQPRVIAYLHALISPLVNLHYNWRQYRLANIYKLEHSWQVCSMRGALNDRFDAEQRRIFINDGDVHAAFYIYTEGEDRPNYIYTETEIGLGANKTWLYNENELVGSAADFTVYVPLEIMNLQQYEVIGLIDFYKLAGKNYKIITI
ncbi:hypothetical protein [Formosa agariphila]|uniref:hypothetical protein n=1 Tax=Formosa agariphila TaxID=320324 RepID=UPI00057188FC|nr:hypothetical protein [Formosa agariphila]